MDLDIFRSSASQLRFSKSSMQYLIDTSLDKLVYRKPVMGKESKYREIIVCAIVFALSLSSRILLYFGAKAIPDHSTLLEDIFKSGLLGVTAMSLYLSCEILDKKIYTTGIFKYLNEFRQDSVKIVDQMKKEDGRLQSAYPEWHIDTPYGNYYELYWGAFRTFIYCCEAAEKDTEQTLNKLKNQKKRISLGKWALLITVAFHLGSIGLLFPLLDEFDPDFSGYAAFYILFLAISSVIYLASIRWTVSDNTYQGMVIQFKQYYLAVEEAFYDLDRNLNKLNHMYLVDSKENQKSMSLWV